MLTADSLRAARDRMRARASRSAAAPGAPQSTVRATLLAATSPDGRRAIVRTIAGGDSVTLDLSHGEWWIGAAPVATTPVRWSRPTGARIALRP